MCVHTCGRHGSHEHPAGAYSWSAQVVRWLFTRPGNTIIEFAACAYGALYRQLTRLGLVRFQHLLPLARPCPHGPGFKHSQVLEGSWATAVASKYVLELCSAWAALTRDALAQEPPLGDVEPVPAPDTGRFEQLFVNEVLRCSDWFLFFHSRVLHPVHINVLEVRAANRALKQRAAEAFHVRQPDLMDSAVGIGVLAKGRSASRMLNAELVRALPTVLGFDRYPAYDFAPTRLNVSDDPTRGRQVREPKMPEPDWLVEARRGHPAGVHAWSSLPRQRGV